MKGWKKFELMAEGKYVRHKRVRKRPQPSGEAKLTNFIRADQLLKEQ